MKQGSADDPFADESEDANTESENQGKPDQELERDYQSSPNIGGRGPDTKQERSLPFIHARDGVKDGRTQRPIFLRDHIESGVDDLVDQMEEEFGETVYKTDVTEAAMCVAQENPDLVMEILEEWGYGWS